MKISFFTLGCKVNQYETETLKNLFFENGWTIVDNSDFADVYVINSCTVTSIGDYAFSGCTSLETSFID